MITAGYANKCCPNLKINVLFSPNKIQYIYFLKLAFITVFLYYCFEYSKWLVTRIYTRELNRRSYNANTLPKDNDKI